MFEHFGEEGFLIPSGTVFFTGCTWSCVYCQNWDISQQKYPDEVDNFNPPEDVVVECHGVAGALERGELPFGFPRLAGASRRSRLAREMALAASRNVSAEVKSPSPESTGRNASSPSSTQTRRLGCARASPRATEEANRCLNCGCVAVNASDIAPALIALEAKIKTTRRTLDAEQFFDAQLLSSTVHTIYSHSQRLSQIHLFL
jgi:hypothetical protein